MPLNKALMFDCYRRAAADGSNHHLFGIVEKRRDGFWNATIRAFRFPCLVERGAATNLDQTLSR